MPDRLRDDKNRQAFLAIAKGLFVTRLHLLRLTEVVRLGVRPSEPGGPMELPRELDEEMRKQAFDYVLNVFPDEFHMELLQLRPSWITPQ